MKARNDNRLAQPGRFGRLSLLVIIACVTFASGCKKANTIEDKPKQATADNSQPAETGIEKVKPAAGTGNVQGKVLFNSQPAEKIEVKLCEKFSQFLGGCSGQTYTAFTDNKGEFVITNVSPKTYDSLVARVFETDSYVFATSGIGISAVKYDIVPDKTFFVTPINLFKSDLKTLSPKAAAKVKGEGLELKWDAYPDTAYYTFSIYADDASVTSPYVNERVDGTSFVLDKPLEKGIYRWKVTAYNKDDRKLAESANDIKFTVN